MISILRSATELDRLEALGSAALECYGLAVRSVSQYAIDVDPHVTLRFREHLETIEGQWTAAGDPRGLRAAQASFRGELRDYRDQVRERLARLRNELENAAAAMASFADNVATNGEDCGDRMKSQLKRLERVAKSSDIEEIRSSIRESVSEITKSIEEMRRNDQLVIAQLQDEIRLLHKEFQDERRALFTDPESGAWTRQKMDLRLHDLLREKEAFCVIVIAIMNLPKLSEECSRNLIEGALKAMLMRFRATAGDGAPIGRWNDEEFVIVLEVDADAAQAIAQELAGKLGGRYAVQENGLSHDVTMELAAGAIERPMGSDPADFIRKLHQLTGSLARK